MPNTNGAGAKGLSVSNSDKPRSARGLIALTAMLFVGLTTSNPGSAQTQIGIEYYDATSDYYFVTSFPDEIATLDSGAFGGVWKRTGQFFNVWSQPVGGAVPTCRFFSAAFAPKSSHFYTPFSSECASVSSDRNWQFESIAFYLQLPDANGACAPGSTPVYRLYNNGKGGAPNHRYTTNVGIFNQMQALGWTAEGNGLTGAFACAPSNVSGPVAGGRVIVSARNGDVVPLPSHDQSWQTTYRFRVPALPTGDWNSSQQTIYVWGDIDFDRYGANGTSKISDYIFNQITPQIFIGRVLSASNSNYAPSWTELRSWAIQAQYFWQKGDTPYAQTGNIVYVNPGEEITTAIGFDASSGKITASISAPGGTSAIVIDRPFPNEPALFSNWSDFFRRAEQASGGTLYGRPVINVEPYANQQGVCSILPFFIDLISIPDIAPTSSHFTVATTNSQSCSNPMVIFDF